MLEAAWRLARARLREEVGPAAFSSWLEPLTPIALRDGVLRLAVPTRFMRDWVQDKYAPQITTLMLEASDQIQSVEIIVQPPARPAAKPGEPRVGGAVGGAAQEADAEEAFALEGAVNGHAKTAAPVGKLSPPAETVPVKASPSGESQQVPEAAEAAPQREEPFSAPLDARFTFDDFVVGKPNELAYAAARRVAEADVVPFNPLFLYGGVGLGKTHLMHAIAWQMRKQSPAKRLIYMSAEKFMYQFVRALRTRDTMAFKEQFRSIDVLMIDDVQFIAGREATQEEFFHTFNALVDQNRQVIISADKSPHDLTGMEERLRSRLGYGLVADIHPTTYELRLGILTAKQEQAGIDVPMKVLEFLAHRITTKVACAMMRVSAPSSSRTLVV
ncbi:MAG: chromosomal replication initiator protein DnaA, partial [Pseudomonadota bacterium]